MPKSTLCPCSLTVWFFSCCLYFFFSTLPLSFCGWKGISFTSGRAVSTSGLKFWLLHVLFCVNFVQRVMLCVTLCLTAFMEWVTALWVLRAQGPEAATCYHCLNDFICVFWVGIDSSDWLCQGPGCPTSFPSFCGILWAQLDKRKRSKSVWGSEQQSHPAFSSVSIEEKDSFSVLWFCVCCGNGSFIVMIS